MGLAEPRKRIKISHDPRNTSWTNSTDSYGSRLMRQQGWQAGEALGAKGRGSKFSDAEAAKVNVKYKDDMLGLGASLKSKDIANQRTGFDAFQGLLGRLNAKTEEEVQVIEKKMENKKLAMFAQGRWGGMLFVPGGILVQSDPYKQVEALKKAKEEEEAKVVELKESDESVDESSEKAKRKAEKKQRREEKRLRKEAKLLKKADKASKVQEGEEEEQPSLPTPDSSSGNEGETSETQEKKKKKRKNRQISDESPDISSKVSAKPAAVVAPQPPAQRQLRNGRHLLRGKNIQAKRMAFSDMKGLDEIFMKVG